MSLYLQGKEVLKIVFTNFYIFSKIVLVKNKLLYIIHITNFYRGDFMNIIDKINSLKKYSTKTTTIDMDKELLDIYEDRNDNYEKGIISYELINGEYETYIYVQSGNIITSTLFYKKTTNKEENIKYYNKMKDFIIKSSIDDIIKECDK